MARLEVDGNKSIYYEDLGGDGRAMVLIHGWGMDNRCWDGVILPLQAAGHRVVTMDHRGCGRSDHDFADLSIAAIAGDVASLVAHLGLSDVVINGWSLGGAVATHAALERQIDVLAESALQKEVATALSASVAVAKKKTAGLLSKTEDAVDSAVELKDFAEDVSQAFGGLQADNYDEDELLEELQAMQMEEEIEDVISAPAPVPVVAVAVDASAYPAAPKAAKKLERKSLLSDDSAAEGHAESL